MAYKACKSWCRALGVRISRQSGMCRRCAEEPQVSATNWEKAVAERDKKIAALEAQVVDGTVTTAIDDLGELADPDF